MAPTNQPSAIYFDDDRKAAEFLQAMNRSSPTGETWSAYRVATGNPVIFGEVRDMPGTPASDKKKAPYKPPKMVDRSKDWKQGGRR